MESRKKKEQVKENQLTSGAEKILAVEEEGKTRRGLHQPPSRVYSRSKESTKGSKKNLANQKGE